MAPRFRTLLVSATALGLLACGGATDFPQRADEKIEVVVPEPYPRPEYETLSETGLFSSLAGDVVADGVEPFEPDYKLWSDGVEKRRFIALPANTQIGTANMDHWQFPIGTRAWKEFSLGGVRIETRLIERYGAGPDDYFMGAFVWNADQSDAIFSESGQMDAGGKAHDVPATSDCHTCHDGEAGRVLGFSALQLADTSPEKSGLRLAGLIAGDRLTVPPARGEAYAPPGDATTQAALGYLHANCGHCHNPAGYCAYPGMDLRLSVEDVTPERTALWQTIVDRPTMFPMSAGRRVAPGSPSESAIVERMRTRGDGQMPFLATEVVDDVGVAAVSAWIAALPR